MDAVQVLIKLEWCKSYSYCTGWPCCPICGGIKPGHGRDENGTLPDNQGHRAGCDLAAAINAHNTAVKWSALTVARLPQRYA